MASREVWARRMIWLWQGNKGGGVLSHYRPKECVALRQSEEGKTMTTKLTLEDLEAMRQHYGIAQREAQREQIPGARGTYGLLENLKEVGSRRSVSACSGGRC